MNHPTDPRAESIRRVAEPLDIASQSVIGTAGDGTIVYWNHGAKRLYGWSESEAVGRNIVDVTPSAQTREQAVEIMTCLRQGQTWSGEFEVRRRNGTKFKAHVLDVPVFDDAGDLIGIVGISTPA